MNQGYQYAMPFPGQQFSPTPPGMEPPGMLPNPPVGQGPSNLMMQPPGMVPPMSNPYYPTTPQVSEPTTQGDPFEESYIENIVRLNRGKVGTFYYTYSDSLEWRDKVYRGIIQAAGKDHFVISDPRDGKRYILLQLYLDYIEFDEPINYEYPIR